MRTLSANALAALATAKGSTPLNLIEIQWIPTGQRLRYADKDIFAADGKIISMGTIDNTIKVSDGSDVQSVSVTLNDTDGTIKDIFDHHDIHKRPCWIYQVYTGVTFVENDKFLLLRGEISSPIVWDEGARQVSFTVISKIESAEVGFSLEEGQFPLLPPELVGKAWPLCFGTVLNVPALKISSPRQGILGNGLGFGDFTLPPRIQLAQAICCPSTYHTGYQGVFGEATPPVNPNVNGMDPTFSSTPDVSVVPTYGPDPSCVQQRCEYVESLSFALAQQQQFEFGTITVLGGEQFQQGKEIGLDVGGGRVFGTMVGNLFTISRRLHPKVVELNAETPSAAIVLMQAEAVATGTIASTCGELNRNVSTNDCTADSLRALTSYPTSDFAWVNAGEKITYAYDEEVVYVANILPSEVLRVSAFRTLENNSRLLLTVPEDYYTVRTTDYTSYDVVEIVFTKALSRMGEGWEDEIFVTLESTVGPNTVDIMEWLIETYTDFTIDSTTFDDIRDKLENYPSHFPLLDRKNILTCLEEIAFQARCAIYLRDNKFYLRYLSEDLVSVGSITEAHVLQNTLQVTTTETEDLVTKFVADWTEDYSKTEKNKLIIRNNVKKYGTHEQTYDFYIYNIQSLVEKSAIFWTIRKSNTWQRLSFKSPLTKLALETFDAVAIELSKFCGGNPINSIIEKADYDSENHAISFEIWTPVLAGTQSPYRWAFPSDVPAAFPWPPQEEIDAGLVGTGGAPGFLTIAPNGHPLSSLATPQNPTNSPSAPSGFGTSPTGCGHALAFGGHAIDFCCAANYFQAPQECQQLSQKRRDDANDKKPTTRTSNDRGGPINTGKPPKFADGLKPKDQQALEQATKASEAAAKARDVANAANEAAGGTGSSGGSSFDGGSPLDKLPKPGQGKSNPKSDPNDDRPTCTTTVTYSWFPVEDHGSSIDGVPVGIPGDTVIETFTVQGCGSGSAPEQPPPVGGFYNSPIYNAFRSVIQPDCDSCAPGELDGEIKDYSRNNPDGSPNTGPSLFDP